MGGSGSRHTFTLDQLKELEQEAKKELKDVSQPKRNVFISFDSEDLDEVNLLRGQAKNENVNLEFNDYSVKEPYDSENAEYIKRKIKDRIKQSSVTLVYISDKTASSKWVDWEIRESIKLDKKVVAMYKGDSPPKRLPSALVENKITPIKWSHEGILKKFEN